MDPHNLMAKLYENKNDLFMFDQALVFIRNPLFKVSFWVEIYNAMAE